MRTIFLCMALAIFGSSVAFAEETGTVAGKVSNKTTGQPLIGVNVLVDKTKLGAVSNDEGKFEIANVPAGEYSLVISYIGYEKMRVNITITANQTTSVEVVLTESSVSLSDVIVYGVSRKAEKITDAPATIQVLKSSDIENYPQLSQLVMNLRGVDVVRSGVDGIGVNARGFNSAFNTKMLPIYDGRMSTLPGNGLPIGTMNTNIKEDVEQFEFILGPSSALYGPNAHNGIFNTVSKDPRRSSGTAIALSGGNQSFISARARHAGSLNSFHYKGTFEFNQAKEFKFIDSVYSIAGKGLVGVAETGVNLDIKHIRGEATAIYDLSEDISFTGTYGNSTNYGLGPTSAGRNYINGWVFQTAQAKFSMPHFLHKHITAGIIPEKHIQLLR